MRHAGRTREQVFQRAVTQAQIIDPHAAEHAPKPAVSGSAAASALDNYDRSFQTIQPKSNTFT